jgi:hypothetical protein
MAWTTPGNQELVFGGDLAPQESAVHALVVAPISLWITIVQRWASAILVRTSAIPQYCGQPKRLRNCGLKKLRNCDCGPSKFDFRNSATLCSLRQVQLLSCPFSSAQDVFKIQLKIFLESSVSVETKNVP